MTEAATRVLAQRLSLGALGGDSLAREAIKRLDLLEAALHQIADMHIPQEPSAAHHMKTVARRALQAR